MERAAGVISASYLPTSSQVCAFAVGMLRLGDGLMLAEEERPLGGGHLPAAAATQRADVPLGPQAADRPIARGSQPLDEWRPSAAGQLSTSRLNALLSGDDGEEMSCRETGSTDAPTGPPRNVPLTLHTVGSRLQSGMSAAPLLAAARHAPGPGLSVQHHSLDSGKRPLSSDDGEPLPLPPPPPRLPSPPQQLLRTSAPRPVLPDVPFEWVTRGVPPLPPKKTTLCAPRFEWVRAATPPSGARAAHAVRAARAAHAARAACVACAVPRRSTVTAPSCCAGAWSARVQLDAPPQPGRRTALR